MQQSSLISEGIALMLTGMGMVFVFLTLLVVITSALERLFGDKTDRAVQSNAVSEEELAAVSAAVAAYRKKHHH